MEPPVTLETIRELYTYNGWAQEGVLAMAERLGRIPTRRDGQRYFCSGLHACLRRSDPLGLVKRNLAALAAWGCRQGASISRPSSSTGTRTTSCTDGGGLDSSGGLRPKCARTCLMATWSCR